jgi:serine/threonine protein kinase
MGVDVDSRTEALRGESQLPRAFGKYLLFDHIGRGGMADIFLARMATGLGVGRRVVVKQILPAYSEDPGFTQALIAEAKLAAQLSHNNIVRMLDLGRESGRLYIAMEYVEGFDLNQLLAQLSQRRLPLPAEFALFIVREVLASLAYAHRAVDAQGSPLGVVHRDVSPSNVLISFEGEVRLCDFGIARAFSAEGSRTVTLSGTNDPNDSRIQRVRVVGKSAYMSPEQARGAEVDARSDVFAVGILLWELCAGRRLYKGTEQEMLELARNATIPRLPDRGLPYPAMLASILARALACDPAMRFQSAAEMLAELDDYALSSQLMASQLRFASFLSSNFADTIVALRRARERAAEASLPPAAPLLAAAPARSRAHASVHSLHNASIPRAAALAAPQSSSPRPRPTLVDPSSETNFSDAGTLRPPLVRLLGFGLAVGLCLALLAWWLLR